MNVTVEWESENCGGHCCIFRSTRSACALDFMQKEQPFLRVQTDPGLSLKAPHLCSWVFPCCLEHRGTYFKSKPSIKTVQRILLQRVKPLSSSGHSFELSLSLYGIQEWWSQQGQELVQGLCQCTVGDTEQGVCFSLCLDRALGPSWVADLSNCIIYFINISLLPLSAAFLQPVGHSWLCWPGQFGGTSWPSPHPAPASILRI